MLHEKGSVPALQQQGDASKIKVVETLDVNQMSYFIF